MGGIGGRQWTPTNALSWAAMRPQAQLHHQDLGAGARQGDPAGRRQPTAGLPVPDCRAALLPPLQPRAAAPLPHVRAAVPNQPATRQDLPVVPPLARRLVELPQRRPLAGPSGPTMPRQRLGRSWLTAGPR
jgi:hypothetical protein